MSFPARPGTVFVVATLDGDSVAIYRYPINGWMLAGGFLVPLTVVPPKRMPEGRHAIIEPLAGDVPLTVIDTHDFSAYESENDWIDAVTPGLAAGGKPLVYDGNELAALAGPTVRDNAPDAEDPDKPRRKRRTKDEIARDKALEEARALQGTTSTEPVTTAAVDDDADAMI
jgi:hypothetical protein